jgi:Arc/MetJ family transcription regulator
MLEDAYDRGIYTMRTTVDLPEALLDEVQRMAGTSTRREALSIALQDYVRRRSLRRVALAAGSLDFDLEARDIRDADCSRLKV